MVVVVVVDVVEVVDVEFVVLVEVVAAIEVDGNMFVVSVTLVVGEVGDVEAGDGLVEAGDELGSADSSPPLHAASTTTSPAPHAHQRRLISGGY